MGTPVLESSKKIKKKTARERWRKKKENESCACAGTFLNEGEKERKEGGDKEIRTNMDGREKQEEKKMYGWNEKREKRNNIKNKKS